MQIHVFTKELIYLGMVMLKYLPVVVVDALVLLIANLKYGDLTKLGIVRPSRGPFRTKIDTGSSSVIDVGTIAKIKTGEIKASTTRNSHARTYSKMHACIYII